MCSELVDARIEATTGLQMSQPVPVPYRSIRPENVRMRAGLDDFEQLGPRLREVLAQRFRDLDALGGQQL